MRAIRVGFWGALLVAASLTAAEAGAAGDVSAATATEGASKTTLGDSAALAHYIVGSLRLVEARRLDAEGRAFAAVIRFRAAADAFAAAAEADPRSPDIYRALSICYVRLNDVSRLLRALAALEGVIPDTAAGHVELAGVYEDIGRAENAIEECRKALASADAGPLREPLLAKLAELLRASRRPEEAVECYRQLLELNPADMAARLGLAYAEADLEHHDAALALINETLDSAGAAEQGEARHSRLMGFLVAEYERAGKFEEGAERFRELLRRNPDDEGVIEALALLENRAGESAAAVEHARDFLRGHPAAGRLRLLLGGLLEERGEYAEAFGAYRELLDREDLPAGMRKVAAGAIVALAERLEQKGDAEAAEQLLRYLADEAADRLDDKEAMALKQYLAALYARMRQPERAARILRRPAARDDAAAELKAQYAEALSAAGHPEAAIKFLRETLAANETNPQAQLALRLALATIYSSTRRDDLAEPELKAALELDSGNALACNNLGYIYADQGRELDEATRLVEIALGANPDEPAYLDSLGWVFYKKALRDDDPELLAAALERLRAAAAAIQDPVGADHLGDAAFIAGRWEEARDSWTRALEILKREAENLLTPEAVEAKLHRVVGLIEAELGNGAALEPEARIKRPLSQNNIMQ